MAKKYEKVKLGLPAYITFAAFLVAIIVMVIILLPSKEKKLRNKFSGSYTVKASEQGGEDETKYFELGEKHIIKTTSFSNLKKKIKKDEYTYIVFANTTTDDNKKLVCDLNTIGKDMEISKLYFVENNDLSDKQKEYLRDKLKKVNSDIISIEKMPTFDIWVTRNDEIVDCYSNPDYDEIDSEKKLSFIAKYHIFNYKNE